MIQHGTALIKSLNCVKFTGSPKVCNKRATYSNPAVVYTDLRTTKCCIKECLKKLPFETVLKKRDHFWLTKSLVEQRNLMLSHLENCIIDESGRRFFHIGCNVPVCRKAWCVVYGIKDTR